MTYRTNIEGLTRACFVPLRGTGNKVLHHGLQVCVEPLWKLLNERVRAAQAGRFADMRVVVCLGRISQRDIVTDLKT